MHQLRSEHAGSRVDPTRDARFRWYALAILTLVGTFHYVDRSVIGVVLEPIKAEFAATDRQMGVLVGLAYGATSAIAGLPIGYLIDRLDRRRLLVSLLFIWSGLTILCGFASSYAALLWARMGVGAAEAGGMPTAMSIISDLFAPARRATAVGIFLLSAGLGTALSFIVGGYIAAEFGWRAAFWVAGGPGVVLALLALFTLCDPPRISEPVRERQSGRDLILTALREPALLHLCAGLILVNGASSAAYAWFTSFLVREHALGLGQAGLVVASGVGLFAVLGTALGGVLSDRIAIFGRATPAYARAAMIPAIFCVMQCLLMVVIVSFGAGAAITLFFLWATIGGACLGPVYGLVMTIAQPAVRGRVLATIQVLANLLGYGGGPFLVGLLSDAYGGVHGLRDALATASAMGLWAAAHFLLSHRRIARIQRDGDL